MDRQPCSQRHGFRPEPTGGRGTGRRRIAAPSVDLRSFAGGKRQDRGLVPFQGEGDTGGDLLCYLEERIGRNVDVPLSGVETRDPRHRRPGSVTEESRNEDGGEPHPASHGGERMPQGMQAGVLQPGPIAYPLPALMKADEVRALAPTREDVGIVAVRRDGAEQLDSG